MPISLVQDVGIRFVDRLQRRRRRLIAFRRPVPTTKLLFDGDEGRHICRPRALLHRSAPPVNEPLFKVGINHLCLEIRIGASALPLQQAPPRSAGTFYVP